MTDSRPGADQMGGGWWGVRSNRGAEALGACGCVAARRRSNQRRLRVLR